MHSEYYSDYDHTFDAYVAAPLAQFTLRNSPREKIWIVEKDNKIVGLVCICEVSITQAQLRWFIVLPHMQGLGLGGQLINFALNFCRENEYSTVILWTAKGLEVAKKIYISNGFELIEEKTHFLWGTELTEQCYQLNF